jgi:MFS transporter, MHS family, proline/betaine transporter
MAISAEREAIAPSAATNNLTWLIVAISLGNALEWFDTSVYAYFAV